jgi:haloalkane dehalogenase
MNRRSFMAAAASLIIPASLGCADRNQRGRVSAPKAGTDIMTATEFHSSRRFVLVSLNRVAYVECGSGPAAIFLHGYPLNGFQWRGVLRRLARYRRCIAFDFMGLGYTQTLETQDLSPAAQADMVASFLDALSINAADVVANDSGGAVAQLFVAKYPARVRTLLLTNCDVHENSPPAGLGPFLELARAGVGADQFLLPQLSDPTFARSEKGLGGLAYTDPRNLTDEAIGCYFSPLVSSTVRKTQFNEYAVAFEPNPLVSIEPALRRSRVPVRMVWGTGDHLFPLSGALWLDRTFPHSRGVRRVEGAKLFFPEEMPEMIAEEACRLWRTEN